MKFRSLNTNFVNLKTTLLTFALAIIIGLVALAQPPWARGGQAGPGHGGHGGGANMEDHFARLLSLTDAQKTQIKNLREQAQTATKPYAEQIKPITEQMHALIEAPVFDETAARALAQKMAQVQIEIRLIQAKTESAIHNLLTPEQKAKLAELHKAMGDGQHDGPPNGGGGGRRGTLGRPGN